MKFTAMVFSNFQAEASGTRVTLTHAGREMLGDRSEQMRSNTPSRARSWSKERSYNLPQLQGDHRESGD